MGILFSNKFNAEMNRAIIAGWELHNNMKKAVEAFQASYNKLIYTGEYPYKEETVRRFAEEIRPVIPDGTKPFREILDGKGGEGRDALRYLSSMLMYILETNPAVDYEPSSIIDAMCNECVFDNDKHALFDSHFGNHYILDKDAGELLRFSSLLKKFDENLTPWDVHEEGRKLTKDPVFEAFLSKNYKDVKGVWNDEVRASFGRRSALMKKRAAHTKVFLKL